MTKFIRFVLLAAGISIWIALPVVDAVARKLGPEPFVYRETASGDNLWNIAREVTPGDGTSRNQVMFAILRKNPDAFTGGNINFLRNGVELTMPSAAEARAEVPEQVDSLARLHKSGWRTGQAVTPQLYELAPAVTPKLESSAATGFAPEAATPPARMPQLAASPSPAPSAPLPPIEPIAPWAASSANAPLKSKAADAPASKADTIPPESIATDQTAGGWGAGGAAVTIAWLALGSVAAFALYKLVQRRRLAGIRTGEREVRQRSRATPVRPADLSKVLPEIEPVGELVARLDAVGFADRAPDEREIDVKLRLAKAYVDVNRLRAAQQILHEVRREGAPRYRRFAEDQLASPTGPTA